MEINITKEPTVKFGSTIDATKIEKEYGKGYIKTRGDQIFWVVDDGM